mmetsp:Transcript_20942/g.39251  ORF Transcript_20942/g.39251 Transcript_20942/m.39251 type:complete len:220 (-) Transcript_20942:331-990(-)
MMDRALRRLCLVIFTGLAPAVSTSQCDPSVPYISFGFEPCRFTFYISVVENGTDFSCGSLLHSDVLSTDDRDVLFWPDSCIGGTACYTIDRVEELKNITEKGLQEVNDTDVEKRIMNEFLYPVNATHVMVNCSEDSKRVVQFAEAAGTVVATSFVVSLIVAMCACAGFCACIWCWCCRGRRPVSGAPSNAYAPVPAYPVKTGLAEDQAEMKQNVEYGSV